MEENRSIHLVGEVTAESVKEIIDTIYQINRYDDVVEKELKEYERQPIELFINSVGGDAVAGMGLSGLISTSKTPIHGIVVGSACSIAFAILMSCHERSMSVYSYCMFHSCATITSGMISHHETSVDFMKQLQEQYHDVILDNLYANDDIVAKVEEKLNYYVETGKDWWINYIESYELGFIHNIIGIDLEEISVDIENQITKDEDIVPVSELEGEKVDA